MVAELYSQKERLKSRLALYPKELLRGLFFRVFRA